MDNRVTRTAARIAASAAVRRVCQATLIFVSAAAIIGIFTNNALHVFEAWRNFDCEFVDGCFQIFDPLRRGPAGQMPGHDFQLFYGLGTLLLHYLPFRLLGSDLLASEAARAILHPLCVLLATFFVLRAAGGRLFALAGTAIVGLAAARFLPTLIYVHNNPMSVRAFLAVSVAAGFLGLFAVRNDRKRIQRGALLVGALAGLAFFLSHDQGTAAIAAGLVTMAAFTPGRWHTRLGTTATFLAAAVGMALASFALIAGPSWHEVLRYNLVEAAGDQFWYFGTDPVIYIGWRTLREYWPLFLVTFGWPALAITLIVRHRRHISPPHRPAVAYLLGYGVLSVTPVLAQFQPYYFYPLWWCLLLILAVIVWDQREAAARKLGPWTPIFSGICLFTAIAFSLTGIVIDAKYVIDSTALPPASSAAVLGVHPNKAWREDLELFGTDAPLWSTYASLPEAAHGQFHPDTDYIIHALGPERRARYVERFAGSQPPIVRTTTDNWPFEQWLWFTHWDFYESLALNYKITGHGQVMTAWTRTADEWRRPDDLPWNEDFEPKGLVTARIDYEISNPWSWLPVFGRSPRYMAEFSGTENAHDAPLSPDREFVTLPMIDPVRQARIDLVVDSFLPFVSIRLKEVKYRAVDLGGVEKKFFGL